MSSCKIDPTARSVHFLDTGVRRSIENSHQIDLHSQPERSEPMLAVNFSFGRILKRMIPERSVNGAALERRCVTALRP